MNKELIEETLKNFDELIRQELFPSTVYAHTAPTPAARRYLNVIRLASYADKLRKMAVARVGELREHDGMRPPDIIDGEVIDDGDMERDGEIQPLLGGLGGMMGDPYRQQNDMVHLMREVAMAQMQPKPPPPQTVGDRALAIRDLLEVRKQFVDLGRDTTTIDAKLDEATNSLKDTNDAHLSVTNHPDLVRPQLLRGHQARGQGRIDDAADRRPCDTAGEGRARQAARGGIEEGVVAGTGSEPVRPPQVEDRAAGANRQGEQGDSQGAEAGPQDHLGGDVQGRDDGRDHQPSKPVKWSKDRHGPFGGY